MKKSIFMVLLIGLVVLTGCGREQTLTCTKDISSSGLKMLQTANIKFIGNKIETMSTTIEVTIPDSYKKYADTFVNTIKNQYTRQYGSYEHVTLNTEKVSDTKINVNIGFDYKKMTAKEKKDLDMSGSERYSVNKKTLENQGFTCK